MPTAKRSSSHGGRSSVVPRRSGVSGRREEGSCERKVQKPRPCHRSRSVGRVGCRGHRSGGDLIGDTRVERSWLAANRARHRLWGDVPENQFMHILRLKPREAPRPAVLFHEGGLVDGSPDDVMIMARFLPSAATSPSCPATARSTPRPARTPGRRNSRTPRGRSAGSGPMPTSSTSIPSASAPWATPPGPSRRDARCHRSRRSDRP